MTIQAAIERNAHHASFTIERVYEGVPPARVFTSFADAEAKRRWCFCHSEWPVEHQLDFRPGGRETIRTGPDGGTVHLCEALYHDIVPEHRIVYSYAMFLDARKISVSLVTVDMQPHGARGTKLVFTEQGIFLDGWTDVKGREEGTRFGLETLGEVLRQAAA